MVALHIISQTDALADCLEVAEEHDEILLIGVAAQLAGVARHRSLCALIDDLPEDFSLAEGARTTDYSGFVDLVARHKPIISWR